MATIADGLPPSPRSWACPRCLGVVDGLQLVRFSVGLTEVPGAWVCDVCVIELEDIELEQPTDIGGYVWGIELLGPIKGRTSTVERRTLERAILVPAAEHGRHVEAHRRGFTAADVAAHLAVDHSPQELAGVRLVPRHVALHSPKRASSAMAVETDRVGRPQTAAIQEPSSRTLAR